jgi:vacuolar protein sorting-associated protein 13A/C
MLESTLSSLLIGVAGKYAHVSAPDVGVSLSGGRLVLENVRLRADAFNFPSLPFTVVAGRAGRLRVNVPWSALSHAPVTVYIENVHLIAGPRRRSLARDGRRKSKERSERPPDVGQRPKGTREGVESDVDDELRSDLDGDRDGDARFADTFDTDDDESDGSESSDNDDSDEDELKS